MALDVTRLKNSLKSNIEAQFGAPQPDDTYLDKYCMALASAIIGEFKANLQIEYTDGQWDGSKNNDTARTTASGGAS